MNSMILINKTPCLIRKVCIIEIIKDKICGLGSSITFFRVEDLFQSTFNDFEANRIIAQNLTPSTTEFKNREKSA
ncbi:hypothetical protein AYI68_g806 [Smittium mucronatum]|uniref:Uncharacterized protein n=1 Tax=Smittium mucronatum TaxID=133383 RepID=A0A1R0H795_9FUNG|nr:hypothetical protein AYI68_g806 [Smittium mucronatum]